MWLANWYFDIVAQHTDNAEIQAIADECLAELERTYGHPARE